MYTFEKHKISDASRILVGRWLTKWTWADYRMSWAKNEAPCSSWWLPEMTDWLKDWLTDRPTGVVEQQSTLLSLWPGRFTKNLARCHAVPPLNSLCWHILTQRCWGWWCGAVIMNLNMAKYCQAKSFIFHETKRREIKSLLSMSHSTPI